MKFITLALSVLLTIPFLANSQKLDLDGKRVKTQLIRFPETILPASVKTYSVNFEGGNYVYPWGLDVDAVKEEFFKLDGFEKVESNGDLVLEIKMSPIRFLDSRINNRKVDSKDSKTGKVTTTYYYWYELTYEKGFSGKLLDKSGKVLWDYSKGIGGLMRSTTETYKSQEFGTYKLANDDYTNNRVNLNRDIAGREIRGNFGNIKSAVNKQYGYSPSTEVLTIWFSDSEKHPENANFKKAGEDCRALFESLQADMLDESATIGFNQLADYYKSVAEKYKADEKSDTKLRYGCYYNLAMIALYLDRPDEAIQWAQKIVENDYDKKDAKGITKDAEDLKALLKKNNATTRRFKRV